MLILINQFKCMKKSPVEILVVYNKPTDFPNKYVVRRWWNDVPENQLVCITDTLEGALMRIPKNSVRIERDPSDDPSIYCSFIVNQ